MMDRQQYIELGSEFHLNPDDLFLKRNNVVAYFERNYDVLWVDSGRTAIKLVDFEKDKKILLPEYICESVINCFDRGKIVFYKIKSDLSIDMDDLLCRMSEQIGLVFWVNYFGHLQSQSDILKIKRNAEFYGITSVEDNTQSLFSKHDCIADYMIASVRKWIPIPHGGILYTTKGKLSGVGEKISLDKYYDNRKVSAMILKDLFLHEGLDVNSSYRQIFQSCEEMFDRCDASRMSDLSKFIASCCDIDEIIAKRRSNYRFVKSLLGEIGITPRDGIDSIDCPFVFLMKISNRDRFRKYLMENRIYCAVHWPFDDYLAEYRHQAKENGETFISLPIDQRYTKKELTYMVDVIKKYGDELRCYK